MLKSHLIKAIDWFIPEELRTNNADLWRARIFVISHSLGPWSGVVIMGYLYRALQTHDAVFWTISGLCAAFWFLPLAMRLTGNLTWIAL